MSFTFCSFAHIQKRMLLWVCQSASIVRVWGVFETRNPNSGSRRSFRDKKSEVSGHPSATLIDQSHHRPFFSTSSKQSFPFWLDILRSESLQVIWELGQIKVTFYDYIKGFNLTYDTLTLMVHNVEQYGSLVWGCRQENIRRDVSLYFKTKFLLHVVC